MRITTEDNVAMGFGDRAFNYYDMKPGVISTIDSYPQPNTMKGQDSNTPVDEWDNYWFRFNHDDGTSTTLDGSRICSVYLATKKGWM